MLTDSVSQFETSGVNDIPKSFQKLISEIQNVKKYKKRPKNASLNIKTVQKNTKKPTTIKSKRNPKQLKPPKDKVHHPEINSDDELYFSKNTEATSNQTSITEYFNTLKRNSSNPTNNSKETKKQDVSYANQGIISSDDDEFLYSNRNAFTHFNSNQSYAASEFQNPDYLNSLSSRNCDLNATIDLRNDFENTAESVRIRNENQPSGNSNWKTFSELNTTIDITDCDFDIDRKKNTAPSIFYSHDKSNSKPPFKANKTINKSGSILKRNQNNDAITNINRRMKNISNNWLNMLKGDQEKMTDLLNQVKSMNDVISKTTHDISKFFTNRNRIINRHP